jgi:hypothetical protein
MSNKYREDPNAAAQFKQPRALKDESPAQAVPVLLHDAMRMILRFARSVWSRWDLHTIPEQIRPSNPAYKDKLLAAADGFFAAIEGFDLLSSLLFSGAATNVLEAEAPRSKTEAELYVHLRSQFRHFRQALGEFLKAWGHGYPVQICTLYDEFWPPMTDAQGKEMRHENAIACELALVQRIMTLQGSLDGLDKILQQKAPALLLQVQV